MKFLEFFRLGRNIQLLLITRPQIPPLAPKSPKWPQMSLTACFVVIIKRSKINVQNNWIWIMVFIFKRIFIHPNWAVTDPIFILHWEYRGCPVTLHHAELIEIAFYYEFRTKNRYFQRHLLPSYGEITLNSGVQYVSKLLFMPDFRWEGFCFSILSACIKNGSEHVTNLLNRQLRK